MNIGVRGLQLIKKWEGGPWLKAKRFGTEKYLSIGYGHYGPDVKIGQTITQAQADALLVKDVKKTVEHVNYIMNRYHYTWNQNQFDALCSFCYNIGSLYQLTANGTRTDKVIAQKILLYTKSGGKELQGLVNRRKEEAALFNRAVAAVTAGAKSTAKKSTHTIALEVIKGLWGNGDVRKKKLQEVGYNYSTIQKEVNKILGGK